MEKKVLLIDEEMIRARVKELGDMITKEYEGREITLICILKGSMYFVADLSRNIDLDAYIEFIRVSSYIGENSTGSIDLKVGLDNAITNKDVIVIEDIVDTGKTLSYLLDYLSAQNPNSLKLCTLLDKPDRREVADLVVDYVGFKIPNFFVIGYGLDYDQKYRNLPTIECIVNSSDDVQKVNDAHKSLKLSLYK